jgi:hypothetical protein
MTWEIMVPTGIFIIAIAGLFLNNATQAKSLAEKFLSIREHETYNDFIKRELDRIAQRLTFLEQTRPTTGELEAKLKANSRYKT